MSKAKKLPRIIWVVIVLAVLIVLFLVLSIVSATTSVSRTIKAIDDIGEVTYSEETKEKIDKAIDYYEALDVNLGLQDKITNIDKLQAAKRDYTSQLLLVLHYADEEVTTRQNSVAEKQKQISVDEILIAIEQSKPNPDEATINALTSEIATLNADITTLNQEIVSLTPTVKALIEEARKTVDQYFTAEESENVPNYKYLTEAESKYGNNSSNNAPTASDEPAEDPELC